MDTTNEPGAGADRRTGVRAALTVLLVLLVLVLLRYAAREHLEPRAALALLQSVRERWWALPAFLLCYLGLTAAFVPAALFHMVAGAAWGFLPGMALNIAACNGASNLQFALARRLGRDRVLGLLERRGGAGLDARLAHAGLRGMILIRLAPLPAMAVNLGTGISAVRWRDFALGTALGTLPVITIYTWFASGLVRGVAGSERQVLVDLVIAGSCGAVLILGPRLLARWRRRRERHDEP